MTLKVEVMYETNPFMNKNDLEFQGHAIQIEDFNYNHWIS